MVEKGKERWVEWVEPFGPNSEPVYLSIPESTAVAKQKSLYYYNSDKEALYDFMVVHWATFRKES